MTEPATQPDPLAGLSDRDSKLVQLAADYGYDPLGYLENAWPWGRGDLEGKRLRGWQSDTAGYIGEQLQAHAGQPDQVIRVARATGHDVGKSAFIGMMSHWAVGTYPDCRGMITANTENQLRSKTWPELTKWNQRWLYRDWFRLETTALHALGNREATWSITRETWSEHNTEAFQGLHNEGKRVVMFFDEASAIARGVCEASEGVLTDEYTQILWILFGNPTRNKGYFFDVFNRWRSLWQCENIDSRTVEGTNKTEIARQVDAYGEDSDFVRVRVRGEFPKVGDRQFIGNHTVEMAQLREAFCLPSDPLLMGVDVARGGLARSVIAFRKGFDARSQPWIEYKHRRDTEDLRIFANRIIQEGRRYQPDMIFIDGDGPGAHVVYDVMAAGLPVTEVRWGTAADEPKLYDSKRGECHGRLKTWLEKGGAIDPQDRELETELIAPEYHFKIKTNALVLTAKDDLEVSTDRADALASTFYHHVQPRMDAGSMAGRGQQADGVKYDPLIGIPQQHSVDDVYADRYAGHTMMSRFKDRSY